MEDSRALCVMVGRCFTADVAYLLLHSEQFCRRFRIKAYTSVATPNLDAEFQAILRDLETASLVIYQPAAWATWGNDNLFSQLVGRIPAATQRITFPYPTFHAMWPFHASDPRAGKVVDEFGDPNSLLYHYADANVIRMARSGVEPSAAFSQYIAMNVNELGDLDGLMDYFFVDQRPKEDETDIKIIDFVLDNFRRERLFLCINHGSNRLLFHMANQILERTGCRALPLELRDQLSEMTPPEIPIHPGVARHFGISWATPETRYRIDSRRYWTFEEYVYGMARP
jgi:hypothetical protein